MNCITQYGYDLLAKGYPIIPITAGFKYPKSYPDWRNIKADRNKVDQWARKLPEGSGLGVRTGGVIAIDLDIWDEVVVDAAVSWIEENIGITIKRVGKAPKLLMVYRTEQPFKKMKSSSYIDSSKRKNHIEILADGQQFVAYGIHPDTQELYQWVSKRDLADTPYSELPLITIEDVQKLFTHFDAIIPEGWINAEKNAHRAASNPSNPNTSADELDRFVPTLDLSPIEVQQHLAAIPDYADDYELWRTVGMALHHQFNGSAVGLALWDEWSQQSPKYNAQEMAAKWGSFEHNADSKPITFATVIKWCNEIKQKDKEELLDRFIEQFVFIAEGNLIYDREKPPYCAMLKIDEFRNSTANIRHEVPAPTAKAPDKVKLSPVHASWMVAETRQTAHGIEYAPDRPAIFKDDAGLTWVNRFYMPKFSGSALADAGVFYEHMQYLFPEEIEREWFIDWIAFNLQRPADRCKVTPLHISTAHGTGRGWVVELISKLLGQWNCTKVKMSTLCGEGNAGGFHDYLHQNLFCAVEEVREGSRPFSISDQIRDTLTENYLEINRKHGSKKTQRVYANFFFMSNHTDALVLSDEDRRINVFKGAAEARSGAYYTRLYDWLKTEGVAALHSELINRDLSSFDFQRSMRTGTRDTMIGNCRSETESLFHTFIENNIYPALTFTQIVREMGKLSENGVWGAHIEEGQLIKLLQHHRKQGQRISAGGRQGKAVRPWILSPSISQDTQAIRNSISECGI